MSKEFNGELTHQIGFLVKRVQQALRTQMDAALSSQGLTTSQYAVLAHLRESSGLSNAELARRSFVTAPTMIRIVQDLEKRGYIARKHSLKYRRVIDMTLTQKGKKVLISCDSKVISIQHNMLVGLSESDIKHFSYCLLHCAQQLESSLVDGKEIAGL